ncbi:purine-nucleoside phosphorylase [Fulvivirgaceae bacterium PWU4]|uniref:Purine nucleoside phosphorylase n=1 Tax=Chryseosolibacter histidini TaxID=2782349 RepID=A0AAP2DJ22_9BACT|nr:purine-nucleoside phosphorylase [Chryseosolibacter histidini]MBT1697226.1 purine-nucleoside phosphorylase [Chryseosolibacter histidini]
MIEHFQAASSYLQSKGVTAPEVGIILGTGLGELFVKQITEAVSFDYGSIPHFPVSTVESHHGKLIYGKVKGKTVLAMQGRFHFYEGYSMQQITLPVRVMKMLGVKYLLISNASGNLNRQWKKGELMLIDDHINLQTENPLRGKNDDALGLRFPDMSQPYSQLLNEKLMTIAREKNITMNKGVYAAVTGPNLETRAEYRFLRIIGADAVGMSTVPEVIVANHAGLPCCAVSVLTDDCDPDNLKPVNISEIIAVAKEAEPKLTDLFVALIERI